MSFEVRGGGGGNGNYGSFPGQDGLPGGPGLDLVQSNAFVSGGSVTGGPGGMGVDGSGVVMLAGSHREATLAVPLRETSPFSGTLTGVPGDVAALLGTVPAGGSLGFAGQVPSLGPGVDAVTLSTQVMVLESGGALLLGGQLSLVFLDSSL